jgi:LysM repeat protein
MNNQSSLIPQGSILEQKTQGRARVKIAVMVVLAVHSVGLLALLMQGCKQAQEPTAQEMAATNAPPAVETSAPPVPETNAPTVSPAAVAPAPPAAPEYPAGATDYTIASGDNFSVLSKKFHVTVKAIKDANPGVEPTKLQIGQKIHIPAAAPAPAGVSAAPAAAAEAAGGEQAYAVKSGDTLTKIASEFGVTVKALRAANDLKTDKIKVGDKLKIPAKTSAPAAPSEAPASVPAPAPAGGAAPSGR